MPSEILSAFAIEGELESIAPFGSGHIHDTRVGTWRMIAGGTRRYVHQRLNSNVFRDIPALMRNIEIVTSHLRAAGQISLTLVPTRDGSTFAASSSGEIWRTFEMIEGAASHEICGGESEARESARALGAFEAGLSDLDVSVLTETIPYFHHIPRRFEALEQAVRADTAGRASICAKEIDLAMSYRKEASAIQDALERSEIPVRVTHNDMKLNNVLFDEKGRAVAIVDLDTVMAGSALYDFGDLARNVSLRVAEDEKDLSKVRIEKPLMEGLTRGYLEVMRERLTAREIELLPLAPRLMALALAVRFLTDHLNGDTYFKIGYEGHNLVRSRTQLEISRRLGEAEKIIEEILSGS